MEYGDIYAKVAKFAGGASMVLNYTKLRVIPKVYGPGLPFPARSFAHES